MIIDLFFNDILVIVITMIICYCYLIKNINNNDKEE